MRDTFPSMSDIGGRCSPRWERYTASALLPIITSYVKDIPQTVKWLRRRWGNVMRFPSSKMDNGTNDGGILIPQKRNSFPVKGMLWKTMYGVSTTKPRRQWCKFPLMTIRSNLCAGFNTRSRKRWWLYTAWHRALVASSFQPSKIGISCLNLRRWVRILSFSLPVKIWAISGSI